MKFKKILALLLAMLTVITPLSALAADEAEQKTFTIASVTPFDGEKEVTPVNLQMDVTFSEPVDASTIKMNNVSVSGSAFAAIVPTGEKTATVYFNRLNIMLGTKYTVTFKSGIKAVSGASLEETKVSFTTMKNAPSYRQITNPQMNDANNIYGLDPEAWSAKIINENGNNVLNYYLNWNEASVRQLVYVKPGRTYTARVRVKASETEKIWLAMSWKEPGNAQDYYHGPRDEIQGGEWTTLEWSWTVPEKAIPTNIKQWIAGEKAGTQIYVDDWYFFESGYDVDPPEKTAGGSGSAVTYLSEEEKSLDKLKAFGIAPFNAGEGAYVSRVSLAKSLLAIMGIKDIPKSAAPTTFTDVDESSAGIVSLVSQNGIMRGFSDTEFKPDDDATADQVIKTLLIIMGRGDVAAADGGYSTGCRRAASELGFMKGVECEFDAPITYKNFAKIVDNALDCDVLSVKSKTDSGLYTLESKDTLLGAYLGYEKGSGILEGNSVTSIYADKELGENTISIDGTLYECDADVSKYLGCKVKFYYQDIPGGLNKVIYIYAINSKNKVAEFSTDEYDIDYSAGKYSISAKEGGKSKNYNLISDKSVIYNGKYLGSYTDNELTFVPSNGSVRLIDSGNGYGVVMIEDIKTYVVGSYDYDAGYIYDYKSGELVDFSNTDKLVILDNDESECVINDIKQWNIISVIQSKDKKLATVYLSTLSVEGSVCEKNSNAVRPYIELGDKFYGSGVRKKYEVVDGYFDFDDISLSTAGIFYMDYKGRIAAVRTNASGGKVAFLVNAYINSDENDVLKLKIFDISGKMMLLEAADRVKIDTQTVRDAQKAYNLLKKGTDEIVSQLILYKMNADGKVSAVDTAYNKLPNCTDYTTVLPESGDDENGFRITYSSILPPNNNRTLVFSPYSRNFSNKVQLSEEPTMFFVPINAKTDEEVKFCISNAVWDLGNKGTARIEAYQTGEQSLVADYLVVFIDEDKYTTEHLSGEKYGIVKKISTVMQGGETKAIAEMIDGTRFTANNVSEFSNAEVGDYIKVYADRLNQLVSPADVLLDVSERTLSSSTSNPTNAFGDYSRMIYANVYEKADSVVRVVPVGSSVTDFSSSEVTNLSRANIFLYDSSLKGSEKIKTGSMSDILDYKTAGSACSEIVILSQDTVANNVLIIK